MTVRKLFITSASLLIYSCAVAQDNSGNLRGQVTGPSDEIVDDAQIQITHMASGTTWRGRADANGNYEFAELPSGDFTARVRSACCGFAPFNSETFSVDASGRREFDVQLAQGFQLNTIGDDFGIAIKDILSAREIPDLPIPRKSNGKPDLTGMWMYTGDPFAPDPQFQPEAAKLVGERQANHFIESPRIRCLPTDLPIPGHTPPEFGKFIHSPGLIVILYEGVLGYRQIFIDGREHPEYPNPNWLGHSIGWWEGDTLVVDTVGFNDRGWTGLTHPRSENFHVVERYTRTSYGEMQLQLTIEDSEVYKEPWIRQIPIYLTPQEELLEFVCENDKWVTPEAD